MCSDRMEAQIVDTTEPIGTADTTGGSSVKSGSSRCAAEGGGGAVDAAKRRKYCGEVRKTGVGKEKGAGLVTGLKERGGRGGNKSVEDSEEDSEEPYFEPLAITLRRRNMLRAETYNNTTTIDVLPDEILLKILSLLFGKELMIYAPQVCKRLQGGFGCSRCRRHQ